MFLKVVGILFKTIAKNDIDFVKHVVLFGLGTDKSLGFLSLNLFIFIFRYFSASNKEILYLKKCEKCNCQSFLNASKNTFSED